MNNAEAFERITKNIPGKFWKGTDVQLAEDIILQPVVSYSDWVHAPVLVTQDNLPPLDGVFREDLSFLRGSLKSRRAQSGVDLYELPGNTLAQHIRQTAYSGRYAEIPVNFHEGYGLNFPDLEKLCREQGYRDLTDIFSEPFEDAMVVANRAARPIQLDKGMGLFRFFLPLTSPVHGRDLESLVWDGEVHIDGDEGSEWKIVKSAKGVAMGVMVRVDPLSEQWINDDSSEPIYITDTERNYRAKLDQFMSPLPNDRLVLCIGETPRTTLSDRVEGVLSKATSPTLDGKDWLNGNLHINSHLIDAGSSWKIRTEILGKKETSRYVYYEFYLNR